MVGNKKMIKNNQKGQALFEMILFLPFLLFLYTIFYTIGNSISGSINQQKAVRGYFYQLVKNNPNIVSLADLKEFKRNGLLNVGFFSIGWREHSDPSGKSSYGNCFKFASLLRNGTQEQCDDSIRDEANKSYYVRVFTVYGVCGPIYSEPRFAQAHKDFVLDQTGQMQECAIN